MQVREIITVKAVEFCLSSVIVGARLCKVEMPSLVMFVKRISIKVETIKVADESQCLKNPPEVFRGLVSISSRLPSEYHC